MIKRHSLYINIWRECLDQGFSTLDARHYAQMEIDRLEKEDRASAPPVKAIVLPPAIRPTVAPRVSGPQAPAPPSHMSDFIKPNSRAVDKAYGYASAYKAYANHSTQDPDMLNDDEWVKEYGQYY